MGELLRVSHNVVRSVASTSKSHNAIRGKRAAWLVHCERSSEAARARGQDKDLGGSEVTRCGRTALATRPSLQATALGVEGGPDVSCVRRAVVAAALFISPATVQRRSTADGERAGHEPLATTVLDARAARSIAKRRSHVAEHRLDIYYERRVALVRQDETAAYVCRREAGAAANRDTRNGQRDADNGRLPSTASVLRLPQSLMEGEAHVAICSTRWSLTRIRDSSR